MTIAYQTPISIVLAEDSEDLRQLVAFHLENSGYTVLQAANGLEALALAREHLPSLVVLDISMPVMDGIEAAAEIRADPLLRGTRIFALSAYKEDGLRQKALAAGCDIWLDKFECFETLGSIIGSMFAGTFQTA